jgi:hypothetical protein
MHIRNIGIESEGERTHTICPSMISVGSCRLAKSLASPGALKEFVTQLERGYWKFSRYVTGQRFSFRSCGLRNDEIHALELT